MKKFLGRILFVLGVFVFPGAVVLAAVMTVTPSNPASLSTVMTLTGNGATAFAAYRPDGTWIGGDNFPSSYSGQSIQFMCTDQGTSCTPSTGAYHYLQVTSRTLNCANNSSTYAGCKGSAQYDGTDDCIDVGAGGSCAATARFFFYLWHIF